MFLWITEGFLYVKNCSRLGTKHRIWGRIWEQVYVGFPQFTFSDFLFLGKSFIHRNLIFLLLIEKKKRLILLLGFYYLTLVRLNLIYTVSGGLFYPQNSYCRNFFRFSLVNLKLVSIVSVILYRRHFIKKINEWILSDIWRDLHKCSVFLIFCFGFHFRDVHQGLIKCFQWLLRVNVSCVILVKVFLWRLVWMIQKNFKVPSVVDGDFTDEGTKTI